MNRKILVTAVAGAIAPMAAQALDVSVSGQVNRAIRFADNGVGSDVQHVDGSASKSRFRFTAEGEAMPGITAGVKMEIGFASNPGGALDIEQADTGAGNADGLNLVDARHSFLYFSGDFGKVSLGNLEAAGNGVMWTSHNGAWMGTEYSPDTNSGLGVMTTGNESAVCGMRTPAGEDVVHVSWAGDYAEHEVDGDEVTHVTGSTESGYQHSFGDLNEYCSVYSFFPSVNIGRKNTLRYDTPSIGPVSFSGSVQKKDKTDHVWSFGAKLSHDVGAANVIGGLILMDDVLGIAGGIAFANGTSVNAAWGTDDSSNQGYEDMYINVAHTWGNTSVAMDYRSTDFDDGKQGRAIGLGVSQSLGGGVDVYAGFNNYSFDMDGPDLEDINAFHIGSRVTFN